MKKTIIAIMVLLIICVISMYCTDDKTEEPSVNDLRIWFPNGYEIMKQLDMNDIEIVSEIEHKLDMSLYFKNVSGDIDSSFQVQMGDLSDIDIVYYHFNPSLLASGLKNELFYNYREVLDQMPNLKKQMQAHPELYQKGCPNDVCVVFPATKEYAFSDLVLAYRSDWAKQVGYEEIQNLSQLEDMLMKQQVLFQKKQLSRQGEYFVGLSSYNRYIDELMRFFQTGDAMYTRDDLLIYGPSTEEYRSYLLYLKGLFQKKLLDPRLYEPTETDMEKFFLNGQSSAILTTYDHAKKLQEFSVANEDDIPLTYLSIEKMAQNEPSIYRIQDKNYQVLDVGYVIKAGLSEEKLKQALTYIDYLYSEEGMSLYNYGIEGKHYETIQNRKRYKEEITKENSFYPIAISPYVKPDLLRIDARSELTMLDEDIQQQILTSNYQNDFSFTKPVGYFTEAETELINDIEISLTTFVQETSMKFIFKDIDPANEADWQDYINGLEHMGLKEYLRIQDDADQRRQQ